MEILTREEAKKIIDKVLAFSKADEMSVELTGKRTGNIRFARNSVSTSGETYNLSLSITSVFGKKLGTSTVNEFDNASLEKAVRRSEEVARLAPENDEYLPMPGPQKYPESNGFLDSTAKLDPAQRAKFAKDSILTVRENKLTGAGFLEDSSGFEALGNSKGLFAYNKSTAVDFSITVRTADGMGSGYGSGDFNDSTLLDTKVSTNIAIQKAITSRGAKGFEPGKYTVILEPTAAGELISFMISAMDARTADEGRSFLSKKGGGTRIGEKLLDERITIYSDPSDKDIPAKPFSSEGLPLEKVVWFDKGVVKNMSYSRFWAKNKGVKPILQPEGFIMEGGTESLADLIKGTDKGILVTRFWYTRWLDPQTLLYTGLTRDGTFYIENGQIKHPVKNFRFNESPVIMLNNLEAIGKPVRTRGNMVPPLKIRDFTFSSLSDAV
ncbi:TldD/PmbA family protein [Dyadobacter sp. NIV53]|uniref:TldD/PmbA family protein n=1 Tax=Dyadobacter sp. NIV53 TaxID=2861765 RepID=UPI001C86BFDB|nr:TldD/PmbA family protein [Dyadobacter sp. NIV53]